jgi:hypothetical protein
MNNETMLDETESTDTETATPGGEPRPATIKRTFKLPKDSIAAMKELAAERSTSVTDVLRRAIWMEKFLNDEMKNGGKVFVEFPDKTKKELVMPR